ncbi:MAG: hormogonium polysaccharide secretion pseudopilin HpsB [Cyanobacteria bacterium P01_H01_bin.150]
MKIYHKYRQKISFNQSGFTIIESLVAIIVVGILMTAIAPTIVLSVATRVQARRVELAADAAKSYIDGARTGTIDVSILPNDKELNKYDAPKTGTLTCNKDNDYCTSPEKNLYCIDGDADSKCTKDSSRDMIVQAFRYNSNSTNIEDGYSLGVRVYRADAFDRKKVKQLKALKDNVKKQSTFTGGTGLTSVQTPLMEITTDVSNSSTFEDFCKRLKTDPNKSC